jgi:hypothetical protein
MKGILVIGSVFSPQSKVEIRNSFLLQQLDWSWIWNAAAW